jgi:hypothetical protein
VVKLSTLPAAGGLLSSSSDGGLLSSSLPSSSPAWAAEACKSTFRFYNQASVGLTDWMEKKKKKTGPLLLACFRLNVRYLLTYGMQFGGIDTALYQLVRAVGADQRVQQTEGSAKDPHLHRQLPRNHLLLLFLLLWFQKKRGKKERIKEEN